VIRFLVTGSTLNSDSPGDLDLMAVMSNDDFQHHFGFTHQEFQKSYKEHPIPLKLVQYLSECEGAKKILGCLFDKRHIDFKFVPETIPYGDVREITLDELKELD